MVVASPSLRRGSEPPIPLPDAWIDEKTYATLAPPGLSLLRISNVFYTGKNAMLTSQ